MYKLVYFVPANHLETVKNALFAIGLGKSDHYEHCCWQVLGEMQYKPLPGSNPAVGGINQLQVSAEYRVEMICPEALLELAVSTLKKVHPYEIPAYEFYKLHQLKV